MADTAALVLKIRRRVHDSDLEPPRPWYADEYYEDSLDRGLSRVNIDLGSTYTIDTLPVVYEYLLELRGTIEMCYVRAVEGTTSDIDDAPDPAIQAVTVPNFTISQMASTSKGPEFWLDLAEKLEENYQDALDKIEEDETGQTELEVGYVTRQSLRTGRRTPYVRDEALDAPLLAASVDGVVVSLSWDMSQAINFSYYEVQRSSSLGMSDPEQVLITWDNHTVSCEDSPGSGTWYYQVAAVNNNDLKGWSAVAQVIVP